MNFFQNEDPGFQQRSSREFSHYPINSKKELLKQQLQIGARSNRYKFFFGSTSLLLNATSFACPELGLTKDDVTEVKCIDENYMDMFGLKILAGEKVSRKYEKDTIIRSGD